MVGADKQQRQALLFLLPALALLGIFVVWPLVRAAGWSLEQADLLSPDRGRSVGLANYLELFRDTRFLQALANTSFFALLVVPIQTAAALFLALLVNRNEPAWRWLRTAFFVPVIVSMPVLAVLWSMLYQPVSGDQAGLVNQLTGLVGIDPVDWLRDKTWALPAIAFMSVWQGLGFQMMLFLAGLQHISSEQLDAARVDGAGPLMRLQHVILPGLRNTIVFTFTATLVLAFRLFVQPYLMTRGGPEGKTLSLIQFIYEETFIDRNLGYACAAALVFLLLVGLLTLIQRFFTREATA